MSVELGRDRKALASALDGLKPDEETRLGRGLHRRWRLKRVIDHLFRPGESDVDFDNQRERLAAAQSEKVEMENAVRRLQLAGVAEVQSTWTDHILAARAKLLALPGKLGPQLTNAADPSVIACRIRTEIYLALAELAQVETNGGPDGSDIDGGEVLAAAA